MPAKIRFAAAASAAAALACSASALAVPAHASDVIAAPISPPIAEPAGDGFDLSAERLVIGESVKGRPIVARRQGPDQAAHRLLVIGQVHGNEPAGKRIVSQLRRAATEPESATAIWTISTLNPDGAARDRRYNARSVDLNRNFPVGWSRSTTSGKHPASEPESQAIMSFIAAVKPDGVMVVHQPLNSVLGYCESGGTKWAKIISRVSRVPLGQGCTRAGYAYTGTMNEWFSTRHSGWFITIELAARRSHPATRPVTRAILEVARQQ